ncbi:hypothetical protein [Weissella cibaria]|uniref:hypothetical protein n=1 Tax=Weissella cibaria TaxID=137591 RepID=UPI0007062617|nr:hypothetical protein [Weissella cibaria]ALI33927.1 hypothetical protein AO080_10955 [Weissella cibaria]
MTETANQTHSAPKLALLAPSIYLAASKVLREFATGSDIGTLTKDQYSYLEMVADNLLDLVEIGLSSMPDDDVQMVTLNM